MKIVLMKRWFFFILGGIFFFMNWLWGDELWSPNGIPIRQGIHVEWQKTICPGDSGTTIFVWSDTRYGSRNVFAQKVNKSGLLLWGEEGKAVTDLPGRQEDPVAIEDGTAGPSSLGWTIVLTKRGTFFYNILMPMVIPCCLWKDRYSARFLVGR